MTYIYVDGNNAYHNLKRCCKELNRPPLYEKDLDWKRMFTDLIEEDQDSIQEVVWYRVEKVDGLSTHMDEIKKHFIENEPSFTESQRSSLMDQLDNLPQPIIQKVTNEWTRAVEWLNHQRRIHHKMLREVEKFTRSFGFRFITLGYMKVDPKRRKTLMEKGLDIAIAINVLKDLQNDDCDRQIIVSNDGDFSVLLNYIRKIEPSIKLEVVNIGVNFNRKLESAADQLYHITPRQLETYILT